MSDKVLICGNEAVGEAAIRSGCRFYAGYPITPQNELTAYMARRMPEVGGIFIQSESELAAINMVYGAAAAGARAMTSSSSPGISLKQEGISYLAGAELPAVIVNMVRGGPGLGNIAPAQSDYFQATKGGGHGDYHSIVLGPGTTQELIDLTPLAFALAEKYRTPSIILGDGILGQMMEPVDLSGVEAPPPGDNSWVLSGARGRKPNMIRSLLLGEGVLEEHNRHLQQKYRRMREEEVRWEEILVEDAEVVLVAYGTSARIARSALSVCRERDIKVGMVRPITLFPFPEDIINRLAAEVTAFMVIEMSAGQMVEDVKLAVQGQCPVHFYGRTGGGVPAVEEVEAEMEKLAALA